MTPITPPDYNRPIQLIYGATPGNSTRGNARWWTRWQIAVHTIITIIPRCRSGAYVRTVNPIITVSAAERAV